MRLVSHVQRQGLRSELTFDWIRQLWIGIETGGVTVKLDGPGFSGRSLSRAPCCGPRACRTTAVAWEESVQNKLHSPSSYQVVPSSYAWVPGGQVVVVRAAVWHASLSAAFAAGWQYSDPLHSLIRANCQCEQDRQNDTSLPTVGCRKTIVFFLVSMGIRPSPGPLR